MRMIALGLLPAAVVCAGCLSFAPPPTGSACAAGSAEFQWLNAPAAAPDQMRRIPAAYDTSVADPALGAGVAVQKEQRFAFRAAGPHLVEIFVANPEADRFPIQLLAAGRVIDERPVIAPGPGRLRPKRGLRHTTLLAILHGPAELEIRTRAPSYVLLAARWTAVDRLEGEAVPRWLDRARYLQANILTEAAGQRPQARRNYLQQLYDRLAFSANAEVRKEALLGRLRAWFWLAAENHEPDDLLQTEQLFREGLKVIPANPLLRQMISASCSGQVGQRMPKGDYCASAEAVTWKVDVPRPPASAPAWAVAQRALVRRMDAITRWWVEKRQSAGGELGGGWGDDVEILRHWGPQALGLGSEVAARGIRNVAGGLWHSGMLLHGYDRSISDVEHSSEPTTDTQPLAAALHPEDQEVRARLGETAACAGHWMAAQPDGFFRFRSSWFNCREADTSPARAVDVHLNTRAMGPALWSAYLTRDGNLIKLIAAWSDSWIDAMRRTAHGKPAGLFPPVVRSRDGSYLIGSPRWDKPEAEWDYFQWSGESQEALTSLVLAAYDLTRDRKYLDAAAESFQPLTGCAAMPGICKAMREAPAAFYVWRRLSADARFDRAFGYSTAGAENEMLSRMARMAQDSEARFSANWDIFTSEVLYTDRVYYPLAPEYRWQLFGGEAPRGDRYPTFSVTWPAVEAEFARAVLEASENRLRIRVYSFESKPVQAPLRLWRLQPGRYAWRVGEEGGRFEVTRLPHLLNVPLPAQREVTVRIETAP